ncbi:MAG: AbrB/MazE/SpoVT family DNA-binding domain-containing protein [candidate division NC10 bacterium]
MESVVSSKGQITLPAEAREKLGLAPGTPVQFELREGGLFLRKGGRGTHPVDQVFGRLKLEKPVDTLLDEMRGPRPRRAASSTARRAATGRR